MRLTPASLAGKRSSQITLQGAPLSETFQTRNILTGFQLGVTGRATAVLSEDARHRAERLHDVHTFRLLPFLLFYKKSIYTFTVGYL